MTPASPTTATPSAPAPITLARGQTIVPTHALLNAIDETLNVHRYGGRFVVWHGEPGQGKTTAAEYARAAVGQKRLLEHPADYRIEIFNANTIPANATNGNRILLRDLHAEFIGNANLRSVSTDRLTRLLREDFVSRNVQWLVIDEAGRIENTAAFDALVKLMQLIGETGGHRFTIVLVGMQKLPHYVRSLPQLSSRVGQWVTFNAYTADEAYPILAALHPMVAALDMKSVADRATVEAIVGHARGLLRDMITLVRNAESLATTMQQPLSVRVVNAAVKATAGKVDQALQRSRSNYGHPTLATLARTRP